MCFSWHERLKLPEKVGPLWKAKYELIDQRQKIQFHISEENGWVKVMDSLLGQIPVINIFTGYFFNPSYKVTNLQDNIVFRLRKRPSFFGQKFEVEKIGDTDEDDDQRVMLGLMMMFLLERRRG